MYFKLEYTFKFVCIIIRFECIIKNIPYPPTYLGLYHILYSAEHSENTFKT